WVAGDVRLPQLGLLHAMVERGPVHHLEIDDEADRLELLLGDERRLVHELVFARADPPHRLARVTSLLHQPLGPLAVALVVERRPRARMPRRLLGEEQRRTQTIEVLVAEAADQDRLQVVRRLHGLAQRLAWHESGPVIY